MPSWQQNASRLNSRNMRTSLRNSCFGFHNFLYHIQSCRIYIFVLIEELPHENAINTLGKNLCLYSLIEV